MRVLVVDDELYTREGIIESVDWVSLGVEEVMEADDGFSALGIAEWFCPDIVISDVKMPQVDGIRFAQQFLERFPESKVIFMSAYLEIQYYRQAIKLSAVDYVEKPLDMEEMLQAVKKAIRGIQETQEKQDGRRRGRIMLEEQAVNYLINSHKNLSRCQELCGQLGFPLEASYICLCFKDLEKENDRQAVVSMIKSFFAEYRLPVLVAQNDGYAYCCILAAGGIDKGRYSMQELGGHFTNQYPSFQIGLGFYVDQIRTISESWKLSKNVLNQAFYEPQKMVFEREHLWENIQVVDSGIYSKVNHAIANEPERLPILLQTIFSEFEEKRTAPSGVKAFAKAAVVDILRQKGDIDRVREDVFFGQTSEEYIENCESLEEVYQVLLAASGQLVGTEDFSGKSPVVKSACRYIRKFYYRPDLGLAEIAEECRISTGYLSMVFKKEMGVTARQFIEEYRIEVAKDRLIHSNERIQDISSGCGFAQQGYFSRVFRQKTGLSPQEFREKHYA